MNRCMSFGIILAVSLMGIGSAHAQTAVPKKESVRAVISKVLSIGTSRYNSSAQSVSAKGVQMSMLVTAERWTQGAGGRFSATEKITQLNFVLPSRMSNVGIGTSICLERLEALRAGGTVKRKLELNFGGYKEGAGNYVATDILGCGEIASVVTPVATPTPKPTASPTPRPTATPTPKR